MKLSVSQIRDVTTGAARVEETESGIGFYRFTKEQEERYRLRNEEKWVKTFSTSGIQMRFLTDSKTLFFSVDVSVGSSRRYFCFEVFVNGERIGTIQNFDEEKLVGNYTKWEFPLGNFSKEFFLGEGKKEVRIYFPWSARATLKEMRLDDGAVIERAAANKKMLCLGDSITHGYDALYPSAKYITRLAERVGAQEYNKAIGGEVYYPDLAGAREDFDPDYVVVSYGSNDWSKGTEAMLKERCSAFLGHLNRHYPDAKILVITPIWRKDMHKETPFGDFLDVDGVIREQAAAIPNTFVVRGFGYVPQDESYFADLKLHPNDKGFALYDENLWKDAEGFFAC